MAEILSGAAIGALSGIAAVFLHIALHETGHLIAGKISGYGFVSIRIFTMTFIKVNGKLKVKRFSMPGTLGQCLMSPPEPKDGKFPYFFYNLGGSLINFITAAAASCVKAAVVICLCQFGEPRRNGG